MVDIEARKVAAEIVRRFVGGNFSNFELENQFPASKDPALWAIEDSLWCFYDDLEEHKLEGKWSIPEETKKLMLRWVAFLYSDQEYQWPKISYPGVRPIVYGFWGRLFNMHKKQAAFLSVGDIALWPFISKESYQQAMAYPVLLAGSKKVV